MSSYIELIHSYLLNSNTLQQQKQIVPQSPERTNVGSVSSSRKAEPTSAPDRKAPEVEGINVKVPIVNKKKSFSLMGFMEQQKQAYSILENDAVKDEPKAETPKWIINYNPGSKTSIDPNIDRELAMDFFNDAVACLPNEKIDHHSVANALEDAVFSRYEGIADAYWDSVHDICAALAGKKKMGDLAKKIIDGEYATPLDVINVPKKSLYQSFEGHIIP